jgi:hypothetical protein
MHSNVLKVKNEASLIEFFLVLDLDGKGGFKVSQNYNAYFLCIINDFSLHSIVSERKA